MSIELYPNQLHQLTAELDDPKAAEMLKLRSLTLERNGIIVRTLQATKKGSVWVCPFSLNMRDPEGDYQVKWQFAYNGEDMDPMIDFVTLKSKNSIKFKRDSASIESKNLAGFTPVQVQLPSLSEPKFSQRYTAFQLISEFDFKKCIGCAHFIQGGDAPNQCQIIRNSPIGIQEDSYCRLWRDSYDLEGFIPEDIDETLPDDVKALIAEEIRDGF